MTTTSPSWPPTTGLCTPTTPRGSAVLTLSASTSIAAPASLVFSILRETSKYKEWNTWCPRVTIHSQPENIYKSDPVHHLGTRFTLHAIMDLKKPEKDTPTQLRITDLSSPEVPYPDYLAAAGLEDDESFCHEEGVDVYRIAWKGEGTFLSMGLQTERFHEVIARGEKECEVRTWEVMSGPVAYSVRWMFKGNLEGKFRLWCEDLKKRGEVLWEEEGKS